MHKKAFLIILDGWGLGQRPEVDAIQLANTPYYDQLLQKEAYAELTTFGEEVGLPHGQMGNSEVGHLNIGAGRIVDQELVRINKATKDGSIMDQAAMKDLVDYAKSNDKPIHLLGLLSDGGVHSHITHLLLLIDLLDKAGVQEVYIHAFMDGRDTAPDGGKAYLNRLLEHCEGKSAKVASIIGRYYAMDRDNRYERIKLAYDLLVRGEGQKSEDALAAVQTSYNNEVMDEFIEPICLQEGGKDIARIQSDDAVLFYNFRTDRPRQLTMALNQKDFPEHDLKALPLKYFTMTEYDENFEDVSVVFTKDKLAKTIGEVVSDAGLTQLRIAETEKYPHVTFFFSGGREKEFEGEDRILIPSPKVATYDLEPAMSANKITDAVMERISTNPPDFICLNYANTDMVGHTGDMTAAKIAAETVDKCLERLIPHARNNDYEIIIIADHGNSDIMANEDGSPHTAHTTNMVPVIYVGSKEAKISSGKLADIAPTLLHLMGLNPSEQMTGQNLLHV